MGNALPSPPQASALTSQEALSISMLAEKGIYPISTYDDLAFGGHVIAYDLRNGVSPVTEARTIYRMGNLSWEQSSWEVACAMAVFAPELVPYYTDGPPAYTDGSSGVNVAA